jgi:hypothetical protein
MDRIKKIPLFYQITLLGRNFIVCSLLCKKLKDKYGMVTCEGIYKPCRFGKMAFTVNETKKGRLYKDLFIDCSDLFILENEKQAKLYLAIRLKNKLLEKELKIK